LTSAYSPKKTAAPVPLKVSICDSTKLTDLVPPPSLLQDKRANIVTCGLIVLGMGSITKRKCSRSPASAHPSSHIGIIISQKSSLNT